MIEKRAGGLALLALASCLLRAPNAAAAGHWVALQDKPGEGIGTMLLLPDGTVMAQGGGGGQTTANWYKLTPDSAGSYVNGTWTSRATANFTRLYYSSAVMQSGQVFFAGAEYGTGTTNVEVYDIVGDFWNIVNVPNGLITKNNTLGKQNQNTKGFIDSACMLLSNGKVLVSPVSPANYGGTVLFDPATYQLSAGPTLLNSVDTDEGGFVKLPDDSILVNDRNSTKSERYIPSLNQWVQDANLPVNLYDPYGAEQGPPILLPNGKVIYFGSTSRTAIYTPSGDNTPGTWVQGPNIPAGLGMPDAPAAMMFNGKVLCAMSSTPTSTNNVFPTPSYFYEYNYASGAGGSFTQVSAPGGGLTDGNATFVMRMLDLPDGNVLFTDGGSQLYVYVPDGSPLAAGKPTIANITQNNDGSFHLTGTLLNGISAGAAYGDDAQMDSNFPLVRASDSSGNVYYLRTFNWSSTSVQTGNSQVSTEFDASGLFPGNYSITVVANGIASAPHSFKGPVWVDFGTVQPFQFGTEVFPYKTLGTAVAIVQAGGIINIKAGSSTETMKITKKMDINAIGGVVRIGHGH